VLECADLAPLAGSHTSSLWEAAKVSELSCRGDFSESSTVTLSDDGKFTAVVGNPTPRR
jgi:hypothetical protein